MKPHIRTRAGNARPKGPLMVPMIDALAEPVELTTESRDIVVRDQRLRVATRQGSGRPLLVCNGIGASMNLLDPFVDALDPQIPVIRFDVPGIGASPPPRRPYSLRGLTRVLGAMLDELGVDDFDVLGISWGGMLAQQIAFQMPRRCTRAVLVSTGPGNLMVPAKLDVLTKMTTPRRHRDADYAASIAADIYGGALRTSPEMLRAVLDNHAAPGTRRGYLYQLLATIGWVSLPFLPLIRQRVLIMCGTDDPIIPLVNAQIMHRLIPGSQLEIFDDGHLGLLTGAEQLGPLVASFLREEG